MCFPTQLVKGVWLVDSITVIDVLTDFITNMVDGKSNKSQNGS